MIYSIEGKLTAKYDGFFVVDVGGVGYKIAGSARTISLLPHLGERVHIFCHTHVREDALDLYGFLSEDELELFESLISVSGVGPKSALSILDVSELDNLRAAIKEGRPDLLTKASGIGRKTAERIILDLRGKIEAKQSGEMVKKMEGDSDIVEALVGLGYKRESARMALEKVETAIVGLEARLKAALKVLGGKK